MGTCQQCGSWSVAGHNHRKVIGQDFICKLQFVRWERSQWFVCTCAQFQFSLVNVKVKYSGLQLPVQATSPLYGNSHAVRDHTVLHATRQR